MSERLKVPALPRFVIATAFGVSSTFQAYSMRLLEAGTSPPAAIPQLLALNLVYWYLPALLAPTIVRVALRYQLGRVRWSTQALVHVTGAVVYSMVHTVAMLGMRAVLFPEGRPGSLAALWEWARHDYLRQLDWLLMTYLFIVGLAHALAYRRESEARALAAANLETRLMEAQLQALQRQLHPHFLFNTLNTISGLMRINVNAADLMIDRLGDLLRMTLDTSGTQQVPLKQELDVLKKYLEIEQTRFESRLSVAMHIEFESLDALVPNLLLQPLVENAIKHGKTDRPLRVTISAVVRFGRLRVSVRDNGRGIPPEIAQRVLEAGVGSGAAGLGLASVDQRLTALYGEEGRLRIVSSPLFGTVVSVLIPVVPPER